MKKLIGLLIVINFGLLGYFKLTPILTSSPQVKQPEIEPEKISILTQTQIEALPKKENSTSTQSATPPPTNTACFEWGVFSGANISNAQNAVARLSLQSSIKEDQSPQGKRFWVYRPPFKSIQEAQNRANELKSLGIDDLFVVQEAKWKNAISFGIFEDEQLAIKLLNELKTKGVKDVEKTLRNQGKDHASLIFNALSEDHVNEIRKLKPEFPEAELKEISCH